MIVWPTAALSQTTEGALRLGPVLALPHIALTKVGIDTNVFNESTNPKRDRTFSVLPDVAFEVRVRRATLTGKAGLSYNYFETYERERSTDHREDVLFDLPLNRLTLKANYGYTSTRQRPGLEIDLRARQIYEGYGVGFDARVRPKTTIRVGVSTARTIFKNGVEDGVSLPQAMNRTSDTAFLSLRHELTSLTMATLTGEGLRDRFDFATEKDATGFRLMPGLEFSKFALISGGVAVGFRQFLPKHPSVPPYTGVAARANLTSVIRRNTLLSGQVDRDLTYSLEKDFPYYVQIVVTLSATQRLGRHWNVIATASGQELAYQALVGAPIPVAADADSAVGAPPILRGRLYSLSAGYLWGRSRIAVEGRHGGRQSGRPDRDFTSTQIGASITYGF